MSIAGFTPLSSEWWHYNLRMYDVYPKYDINFAKRTAKSVGVEDKY